MSDLGKQGGAGIPAQVSPPCEGGRPVDTGKGNKGGGDVREGFIPPTGKGNPARAR
jgi:hypothetical protein